MLRGPVHFLHRGVEPAEYRSVFPSGASRNFRIIVCPPAIEIGTHCGMPIRLTESRSARKFEYTPGRWHISLAANTPCLRGNLNIEERASG